MQIRLTVVDPLGTRPEGRAVSCDVLVTAPAGTALAAVSSGLASAVGGEGPGVLYAGAERLDAQRCTLGEPPLIDGAVLCLGAPAEPGPEVDAAEARLHVVAGPDAGGVHLLHGGRIDIGRSADADVPLDDPDVSRLHCAVTVAADGRVSVADLGSTNGTTLDGTRVGERPVRLAPGALLRVGESALRLARAGDAEAVRETVPDGEGHVRVLGAPEEPPRPRAAGTVPHARVGDDSGAGDSVALKEGDTHHGFGTAGWGAAEDSSSRAQGHGSVEPPVATGQGAGAAPEAENTGTAEGTGRPGSTRKDTPTRGTAVPPRGARKRGGLSAWARRLAGGRGEQSGTSAYEESAYEDESAPPPEPVAEGVREPERWPDPAALLLTALGPGPRLWERDPEHPETLAVRLGTADRSAPDGSGLLPAVPVTTGLREVGALGIAGPRPRLSGLARAVVAQLAALHSPDTLEIVLLSADRSRPLEDRITEWSWLGWLPHIRPAHGQDCHLLMAYDREQTTSRTEELLRRLDDHTTDTDRGTARRPSYAVTAAAQGAQARITAAAPDTTGAVPAARGAGDGGAGGGYGGSRPSADGANAGRPSGDQGASGRAYNDAAADRPRSTADSAHPGHPSGNHASGERGFRDGAGRRPDPSADGANAAHPSGSQGADGRAYNDAATDRPRSTTDNARSGHPSGNHAGSERGLGDGATSRPGATDASAHAGRRSNDPTGVTRGDGAGGRTSPSADGSYTGRPSGNHAGGERGSGNGTGARPRTTAEVAHPDHRPDVRSGAGRDDTSHRPIPSAEGAHPGDRSDDHGSASGYGGGAAERASDPAQRAGGERSHGYDDALGHRPKPSAEGAPPGHQSGNHGSAAPGMPLDPTTAPNRRGGDEPYPVDAAGDHPRPTPVGAHPGHTPNDLTAPGNPNPSNAPADPASTPGPRPPVPTRDRDATHLGIHFGGGQADGTPRGRARDRRPSWAQDDEGGDGVWPGPFTVVVVDGDPGPAAVREAVSRLAVEGPRVGIHVVCLAETAAASPASPVTETYEAACAASSVFRDCGAVALLSGDVATALRLMRVAPGAPEGAARTQAAELPRGPVGHGTVAAVDAVSMAWAERFARALAPLRTDAVPGERHARVSAPLPQAARLLDELGLARATPASLMARWADAADDTEALGGRAVAVLGAGPRGPASVDLAQEGPHLLIEGPSGSGRTELLRSVAASLAAAERPDRLGIVLIDGWDSTGAGAASRGDGLRVCTDLPHVTTHLAAHDPVRMREFAQSLTAELKRRAELLGRLDFAEWHARQRLQGRIVGQRSASTTASPGTAPPGATTRSGAQTTPGAGAADLDAPPSSTLRLRPAAERQRAAADAGPPLPRLAVIVDDLDALLSPALGSPGRPAAGSVVRALEAVARSGHRLGVHLVAATAGGPRSDETELARQAALRIALEAPSSGPEDPAPGRGRLTGPRGRSTPFQGGRVTGRIPRTSTLRPTVVPLEWDRMGDPPARRPVRELGNGPTDLALLASALERAARSVSATEVPSLL
ncbi:FHA domain-containing protein [Streptomyces sp. CA-288835]|uniref:FHA domain-containing protein n=1 Tax=Streptomyces sp. CA-288835 TaxID=3240069 RepID=UPI003D9278F4